MTTITGYTTYDLRFPTSLTADGSDAMNKDGDHSAAYVVLHTDTPGLVGTGFTFTIGRGNDVCVQAMNDRVQPLIGRSAEDLADDLGGTYRGLASDSQLRWLGPDKGVEHLAMAAVMNAVWDLSAKLADKPIWRFVADMTPEQIVDAADMSYLADELTPEQALAMLRKMEPTRKDRIAYLEEHGYPCYSTAAGWLGYSDEKMKRLIRKELDSGQDCVKLKVGLNVDDDIRRCRIARDMIGPDGKLMVDANQVWDVPTAIDWMRQLEQFHPFWIEEPTHPDDVLGHAAIRKALNVKVATGEHGMNRILHKQMLQAEAYDFCQIDACRLASLNEVLAVLMMAANRGVPVCPHGGGVGLCELIQHLAIIDYVVISGGLTNRYAEYVDHLHEHMQTPCQLHNGNYALPKDLGYTSDIKEATLAAYSYPNGTYWSGQYQKDLAAKTAAAPAK